MRKYLATALLMALLATGRRAGAQQAISIELKDGRAIESSQALTRSGNAVMVTVPMAGGQQGQVGYDVSTIARVDFPEPTEIQTATDLLAAGQTDQGIAALDPVLAYYEQFRDVPGSWWAKAAVLKINALVNAGRASEAAPLVDELAASNDPEAVSAARVQQAAEMIRGGRYEEALPLLDASIKQTQNKDTLAQAWFYEGVGLSSLRRWEPAILAYLHVPVLYPEQKLLVPQAMLGGAQAMIGLQDRKSAKDELEEVVKNYPSSPQAGVATTELQKLEKDQSQNP